jgi:hypothetical protein
MRVSNAIGQLINACIDDERMLTHEKRAVGGRRRQVLEQLERERARSIEQLRALSSGTVHSDHASWIEQGREAARMLRGMVGGPNGGDSVSACLRSCRRTEERFDEALLLPWPDATRTILVEQRARLDDAHAALVAVRH